MKMLKALFATIKKALTSKIVWAQLLTLIAMIASELLGANIAPALFMIIAGVATLTLQQYFSDTQVVFTGIEGKNAMFVMNLLMIFASGLKLAGTTEGIFGMSAEWATGIYLTLNVLIRVFFLNQNSQKA